MKHQPERTCIVCRQKQPKTHLVRMVRTPQGAIILDRTGKVNGRGAYVCQQTACWQTGLHKGHLARALRTKISGDDMLRLQSDLAAQTPTR